MKHKVINMERSTLIILATPFPLPMSTIPTCVTVSDPTSIYGIISLNFFSIEDDGYFGGADDAAGEAIEETGFEPWFSSIWEPPSGEIESLLFALQAAIGAIIIGYFFGYWRGQGKEE